MDPTNFQLNAQTALANSQALPTVPKGASLDKIRKTAQDFEAVFLSQMLKPMFEGLSAEAPFGGGAGEDMWRSQMVNEYGKTIAKAGGIGIADQVMGEMIRMQEAK